MWYLLLLLAGFLPLVFGAKLLVDNASSLAKKLDIPDIVIGLTIVGFGTSTPELIVTIFASVEKNSDIVLGNILGSNILNILGIIGISALVYPVAFKKNTIWIEIPFCLLSAVVVFFLANDKLVDGMQSSFLSRIDGVVLLFFFLIFIVYNIRLAMSEGNAGNLQTKEKPLLRSVLLILTGLLMLIAGGRIIVISAVKVATFIGISERIIALTVVAIGTSLPELATSVTAAVKRNSDIAIGNIIGSNIFNVFFILGLSAVINPVSVIHASNLDIIFNIGSSLLLFVLIFFWKGRRISRLEGMFFIFTYLVYLYILIIV